MKWCVAQAKYPPYTKFRTQVRMHRIFDSCVSMNFWSQPFGAVSSICSFPLIATTKPSCTKIFFFFQFRNPIFQSNHVFTSIFLVRSAYEWISIGEFSLIWNIFDCDRNNFGFENFYLIWSTFSLEFSASNSELIRYSPFGASTLVSLIISPIFKWIEIVQKINNNYYYVNCAQKIFSQTKRNSIQKAFTLIVYISTTKQMLIR